VTVGQDGNMIEEVQTAVKYQAKRIVNAAQWESESINNKEPIDNRFALSKSILFPFK
jgi:hypothetical protein